MLVPNESPLRQLPVETDPRLVLFVDGIRYSMETLELTHSRLLSTLESISGFQNDKPKLSQMIAEAISDAWGMVDSAHRLRELVQQMPRLKKSEPDVQLLIRETKAVEDLRNFAQHFRTGIDGFVSKRLPLWGTLSWNRQNAETGVPECHTIIPGTYYNHVMAALNDFNSVDWQFSGGIILRSSEAHCDLVALFQRISRFAHWFAQWFENEFPGANRSGSDVHLVLRG